MPTIRYDDYTAWEKDMVAAEDKQFRQTVQQKREAEVEQPIATFYDGFSYVVRRPMDTHVFSGKAQRVFENRQAIVGDGVADFSLMGVLTQQRPELVRNFDDEDQYIPPPRSQSRFQRNPTASAANQSK